MYIDKINKLTDGSLINAWAESSRDEYAAALMLRYLPFVYGVCLREEGDAARACDDVRAFSDFLPSVLHNYDNHSSPAQWLYYTLLSFLRKRITERRRGHRSELTPDQKTFLRKLAAEDEQAVSAFEEGRGKLSKPQRESMELFFFERKTFESIAERTGYLTNKIRPYIESGITALSTGKNDDGAVDFSTGKYSGAFLNYLKGYREDNSAYEIELASMQDPFLSDAVEGYFSVDGDHMRNIIDLEKEIETTYFPQRKNKTWLYFLIAAALIIVSGVFVYHRIAAPKPASATEKSAEYEPQPEQQYSENGNSTHTDTLIGDPDMDIEKDIKSTVGSEIKKSIPEDVETNHSGPVSLISVSKDTDTDGGTSHYTSLPMIGKRAYNEYLSKATVGLDDTVTGNVTLTFNVNRYGRPSRIRITEYLSPEAHREAIRLLDNGPEWSPTDKQVTIIFRFEHVDGR